MKNEEAAAILTTVAIGLDPTVPGVEMSREALLKGVEALHKQIPQNFTQDKMFVICPQCKKSVLPTKYCTECGQALMGAYVEKE